MQKTLQNLYSYKTTPIAKLCYSCFHKSPSVQIFAVKSSKSLRG